MMLVRIALLVAICCTVAACVTAGGDVGSAVSTDAYVKKALEQRGL